MFLFAAILSASVIASIFLTAHVVTSAQPTTSGFKYNNYVCTYYNKWNGHGYEQSQLVGCSHNVVYNNGINMTRDMLGYDANYSIRNITLCNASTTVGVPVAGGNEACTVYAGCGMVSKEGTYGVIQTSGGNWTVYTTFTSTCSNAITNLTRLTNSSGSAFSGNTFNLVNLSSNDQLTVNWTISVS